MLHEGGDQCSENTAHHVSGTYSSTTEPSETRVISNAHNTTAAAQTNEHRLLVHIVYVLRSNRYYIIIRAACDRACSRCTPLCFRTDKIIRTATHRDQNRDLYHVLVLLTGALLLCYTPPRPSPQNSLVPACRTGLEACAHRFDEPPWPVLVVLLL